MRLTLLATFAALTALTLTPADAQRRQPTPEQRIDRLEKQVRQVQGRVFPKGQPADTAGFSDEPAATLIQTNQLSNRLDAIERQMAEITRTSEENANRVATMEAELARLRADSDQRLRSLESAPASAAPADEPTEPATTDEPSDRPPPAPRPKVETADEPTAAAASSRAGDGFVAAGEEAYDRGFRLWQAGKYDEAISSLRAMASSFPGHRRVSWAYNLAGRALLDKGQAYAAAEALLANYRRDPNGERAADSLFYLGQASMKLRQPEKACMAYSELQNRYGASLRAELQRQLPAARAAAKCG